MRKKDNRPPKENRPPMPPTPPYPPYPNKRPKPFKPHNHRAHFAPPLMQYHIPHAFKFWCNQTLPFVYDDSLSFYELLNKVVHYMNNMFEDEKLMTVNIGELAEAYKALEQFVNDYFSFYQSKGLIVYDVPVTNANYREILPDCDTAQMNTIYRLLFVDDSTQNIPANLPDDAKPFSDSESLLINISNFVLKFVGGVWQQPPVEENETATENPNMVGNYQLLITDRNFFIRQHNGDTWGEWESIFGNWYAEIWEQIKEYIDTHDEAIREELLQAIEDAVDDLTGLINAEVSRATAAENALGVRIDANVTAITNEINRAMSAESDLSARITAEVNRATAAEGVLDDKIEDETDAREAADTALSNAITAETTRATNAENTLSAAITAEVSRATTAENDLSSRITAEVSRATAAENALSARIQTWETDLAAETLDRQQGDRALGLRIDGVVTDLTSEVSRATAAEQGLADDMQQLNDDLSYAISQEQSRATNAESGLQSDIDTVASDLSDFEDEVRDGYIPNAGNTKSGGLSITRADDVDLSSTSGDVHINADTAYYNGTTANDEIATVGDISTATSGLASQSYVDDGYIPNAGNNKNDTNFSMVRRAYSFSAQTGYSYLMGEGNGLFNVQHAIASGVDPALFRLSKDEFIIDPVDDTWIKKTARTIAGNAHNAKAYYGNTKTANNEIATIGDVNTATSGMATQSDLAGYVPNEGNDLSSESGSVFEIVRDSDIVFQSTGEEISLTAESGVNLHSNNGKIAVDSDGWARMHGYIYSDIRVHDTSTNDDYDILVGNADDEIIKLGNVDSDYLTLILGNGSQPNNYEDGINVFNQRVYIQDQFTAAYDNTDTGRYGATTNKLELSNLGISGQTQHGNFVPELHHDASTLVQPNNSLTGYGQEKIVFDLRADVNYIYQDTLEIPYCREMIFNGAVDGNDQTQISGDISITPNSSLVTLTNGDTKLIFNNIVFVGKDPTNSQGGIIDCDGNNNSEVIFNNCKFTVTPYILKNFTSGKVVFKNCVFTANYAIQFGYSGTGDNAEIIVDGCVFAGTPSAIQLNANNAGCTFIVTNNKVGAVTTNPISAFPSTVYEWNNSVVSSGYSETVLWTNPDMANTPIPTSNITLGAALNNFDAIFAVSCIYYGVGANPLYVPCVIPVSQLMLGRQHIWSYINTNQYDVNYVDTTHLTLGGATQSGASGTSAFEKIIGIKY